jgi:hypothetical protein
MESILNSTKKILGLEMDYTAFDLDVLTHINTAFSVLDQVGIGPAGGFFISGVEDTWEDFSGTANPPVVPANQLNMVKTYVYLKVRYLFDPPSTGYAVDAMKQQIEEFEGRLNLFREDALPDPVPVPNPWEDCW